MDSIPRSWSSCDDLFCFFCVIWLSLVTFAWLGICCRIIWLGSPNDYWFCISDGIIHLFGSSTIDFFSCICCSFLWFVLILLSYFGFALVSLDFDRGLKKDINHLNMSFLSFWSELIQFHQHLINHLIYIHLSYFSGVICFLNYWSNLSEKNQVNYCLIQNFAVLNFLKLLNSCRKLNLKLLILNSLDFHRCNLLLFLKSHLYLTGMNRTLLLLKKWSH